MAIAVYNIILHGRVRAADRQVGGTACLRCGVQLHSGTCSVSHLLRRSGNCHATYLGHALELDEGEFAALTTADKITTKQRKTWGFPICLFLQCDNLGHTFPLPGRNVGHVNSQITDFAGGEHVDTVQLSRGKALCVVLSCVPVCCCFTTFVFHMSHAWRLQSRFRRLYGHGGRSMWNHCSPLWNDGRGGWFCSTCVNNNYWSKSVCRYCRTPIPHKLRHVHEEAELRREHDEPLSTNRDKYEEMSLSLL